MIYVDDAGIQADVLNEETGQTHSSRWYHLISDQIDQTELHEFAVNKLKLRKSYFQPGKQLGRRDEHDPSGDHYDLTEGKRQQAIKLGAKPIPASDLAAITMRKRAVHRFGFLDIAMIANKLAEQEGTFALGFHGGKWSVAIEWGKEAEDSPMVGAAAYGMGDTAQDAVFGALKETGWLR
jgi:hypothetical protein